MDGINTRFKSREKQDVFVKHHAPAKGLFLDSFGVTGEC